MFKDFMKADSKTKKEVLLILAAMVGLVATVVIVSVTMNIIHNKVLYNNGECIFCHHSTTYQGWSFTMTHDHGLCPSYYYKCDNCDNIAIYYLTNPGK